MILKKKKVVKKVVKEKIENVGVTPPKDGDIGSQLATVVDESE